MKRRFTLLAATLLLLPACDGLFGPDGWVQDWKVDRKQPGVYNSIASFRALRKQVRFEGVFAIPHEGFKLEHDVEVGTDTVRVEIRRVETSVPTDSVPAALGFDLLIGDFASGSSYTFVGRLDGVEPDPFVVVDIAFSY